DDKCGEYDVMFGEGGVAVEFVAGGENQAAAQADPAAIPASGDCGGKQDDQCAGKCGGKADDPDGIAVLSQNRRDGDGNPVGEWRALQPGAAAAAGDDPVVGLHHFAGELG